MLAIIPYPQIDPVLIELGPLAIRWYALAYVVGLIAGWRYVVLLNRRRSGALTDLQVDDLLVWVTFGVILGGRIGYVLFYNLPLYLERPLAALRVWEGGMSFHGGLIGVIAAALIYARRRGVRFFALMDLLAATTPIGLFLGRLANFVNGELYGRPTDVPWAMVFPTGGPEPRHPSQLYEAALEGLLLFALLNWLAWRTDALKRPGLLSGVFLLGYAAARAFAELFRTPDAQIGFLAGGSTMGQWLSAPMLAIGLYLVWRARAPRPR